MHANRATYLDPYPFKLMLNGPWLKFDTRILTKLHLYICTEYEFEQSSPATKLIRRDEYLSITDSYRYVDIIVFFCYCSDAAHRISAHKQVWFMDAVMDMQLRVRIFVYMNLQNVNNKFGGKILYKIIYKAVIVQKACELSISFGLLLG